MRVYRTAEVAKRVGVHPNTVRLYETWQLIPAPARGPNGYRIFTEFHLAQIQLARRAFQVEVLQNGLRKRAVQIVRASADRNWAEAKRLTGLYRQDIRREQRFAEEAIGSVRHLLRGDEPEADEAWRTRKQAADELQISMDCIRNWEMNGLLTVKRKRNGYRVYSAADMRRLTVIRSLRCANYSLAAILRMLGALSRDPRVDVRQAIDTPGDQEEMIAVCDRLLTSLRRAEENARWMSAQLEQMERDYP